MTKTKRSQPFHFKQFSIIQDDSAMKVGTDGVLLGAWADLHSTRYILDIGAGTGLISLMLAQRNPKASIDAVELDEASFYEARLNIRQSPWSNRISLFHDKIQHFAHASARRYDLIVTNPPFFSAGTSSPHKNRHQARHGLSLQQEELLECVNLLMTVRSRFCIILPMKEGLDFIDKAKACHLFVKRQLAFFSKATKKQERWLLEFRREPSETALATLIQYDENGEWSDEYKTLTRDFYLKL